MHKYYYILMYDISEDKNRSRLQKKLLKEGWAMLQYSVYIKFTSKMALKKLEVNLARFVNLDKSDSLFYTKAHIPSLLQSNLSKKLVYYLSEDIEHIFV